MKTYLVEGFGFEVEVPTFGDEDAAKRRAMFSLMAAGYLDPKGTPAETMAEFRIVGVVA